ncbi:hypothetical protein F66182_1217 [Fusarium sp. NRRL 66182]|nr:hypothetical protein F66182_1217 [Fusarium sp. NRRL 66182]
MANLNPIPHNSIRLLTLSPGKDGEPLHCGIRAVGLNDGVQYEALSYVWGTDVPGSYTVDVAGQAVHITASLFAALGRLRNTKTPRTLWIDQLCIDQWNLAEKEQQVGMMRSIYQNCSQCLIWLGDISPDEENFTLQDAASLLDFFKLHSALRTDKVHAPKLAATYTKPATYEGVRKALCSIRPRGNPWWHRTWTIQEAIIPPKATVQWGSLEIAWKDLTEAAMAFNEGSGFIPGRPDLDDMVEALWRDLGRLISGVMSLNITKNYKEHPLVTLRRWRNRYATDPRDKIYALMGLFAGTPFPSVPSCDYTLAPSTLYSRVALDMIRETESLEPLIGMRGDPRVTPDLPSWVFDMTMLDESRTPNWFRFQDRHEWFSASGDGLLMLDVSDDERAITLQGVYLDTIEHVSNVITDDSRELAEEDVNNTLASWEKFLTFVVKAKGLEESPTGLSWDELFCRTVMGDLIFDEFPIRRATDQDCDLLRGFRKDGGWNDTWESVSQMLAHQAFFVTRRGYVGIGSPTTRAGDSLWVLFGGNTPFVLGATSDDEVVSGSQVKGTRKVLVGEAYVHGFMDGEAVEKDERQVCSVSLV